jgi:hypothetical protein
MTRIINSGLLVLVLLLSSCSIDIEVENFIDMSTSFKLTINNTDSQTGLTKTKSSELPVNSDKWNKLIEWGKRNKEGWQSSPASYIGDIYVIQGDFRLIHTRNSNGVVIAFIDSEGNTKQYTKGIDKGELDFLTN